MFFPQISYYIKEKRLVQFLQILFFLLIAQNIVQGFKSYLYIIHCGMCYNR